MTDRQACGDTLPAVREALELEAGERVVWATDDHGIPRGYAGGVVYGYTVDTERYVVALRIGDTWDGLVTTERARDVIDRHMTNAR